MRIQEIVGGAIEVDRKKLLHLLEQWIEQEYRRESIVLTEKQEGKRDESAECVACGAVSAP